jgi:hypothetical protein
MRALLIRYFLLTILTVSVMAFGRSHAQPNAVLIKGKVINESTGKPIGDVHVFIVDGEEEALTNAQGEFTIRSWQKGPFKVTAEKAGHFGRSTIVVSDPSSKAIIRIKDK